MKDWIQVIPVPDETLWDLSIMCEALYENHKDTEGKRVGPLVPYAGKDKQGRNLVGDVYFNFAMIEEHMPVVVLFARTIAANMRRPHLTLDQLVALAPVTTIVGIPDGGRTLGQEVARIVHKRFVYPTKVARPKAPGATKEEFDMLFKRHELSPGEKVLVCDDVGNNFYNTDIVLESIAETGAEVCGLLYALNRSPTVDKIYIPKAGSLAGKELPIIAAIRKPLPEYEVDDPEVAVDIAAGNFEKQVKANWAKLRAVMTQKESSKV